MPKWHLLGQSAPDHQHAILPPPNPLILLHLQSKLLLPQIFVIAVHDCCILPLLGRQVSESSDSSLVVTPRI